MGLLGGKTWTIPSTDDSGKNYKIEAKLGLLGGETILLDGREVSSKTSFKLRSSHIFDLPDGRKAEVKVGLAWWLGPKCELVIGAEGISTGVSNQPVPKWCIPFLVLMGIMPIITLGGALPVIIALGGIGAALKVARSRDMGGNERVIWVGLITVSAWGILIAFLFLVGSAVGVLKYWIG